MLSTLAPTIPTDSVYVTSTATLFEDTHVVGFVENVSANLHRYGTSPSSAPQAGPSRG